MTGITLALDAHGGDHGRQVTIAAARDAIARDPRLAIVVCGLPQEMERPVRESGCDRLSFAAAKVVLPGDARPATALRRGGASSLGRALELVADHRADACVSAGSTVALMTLAVKIVGMAPGVRRPALMSDIPSAHGFTSVLDLGANLHADTGQLVQFAIMGAVARSEPGSPEPSVGLLNVGHEETKGHSVVRAAHERLLRLPLNYRGFVEGHDIFAGRVDVAVCDGFSGNLMLKSSEGLARMLFGELRKSLDRGPRERLAAWLARPALGGLLDRFDPAKHNGAPLLGLRRVVVKSHGSAGREAMCQALLEAGHEALRRVPERIGTLIQQYEAETEA